ncbi:MAG: DUF4349 domain-containing protein [Dehalococcoidia bacterium]|nr:DUF4349 domain-containing protein [Dehalococcoidia bacterium]
MKAKTTILIAVSLSVLLVASLASACGGSDESEQWARQDGGWRLVEETAMQAASDLAPGPSGAPGPAGPPGSPSLPGLPGNPGNPGALAPAAPAAAVVVEKEVVREVEVEKIAERAQSVPLALSGSDASTQAPAQLVTQRRIIVRTADMVIVVDDIQAAIDDISRMADSMGGWVVSTDRSRKHDGSVSIRVPAVSLDLAIEELRELAKDVETEITTSQDVTDEYYDLQSRLKNQQATEAALIRLLDRAENVEHALAVQRELSNVQENVERLLGRIKLLEETSAFSLITVRLRLAPLDMAIDAGPDQSVAVHSPTRFRATFTPPEGMDQHSITWDFGDGSEPVYIGRTAPTTTEGERVTATVTHTYNDPKDSPFIVQVTISSFGESGVAEGEDTLIVSVSEIPVIEVYAGNDINAVQDEEVVFTASFTRPAGLTDVRYEWDFGDGSPIFEGEVSEGTRVATTHSYSDYRPDPYRARLTIIADSAVGEVSSSQDIYVFVDEELGLVAGGFDVGDTGKTAVRTLTLVVSGLTTAIIWFGVFAFIWVPLAVLIVFLVRKSRRFRAQNPTGNPSPPVPQDEPGPGLS